MRPPPPYGSPAWDKWWQDFNKGWDEDLYCTEELSSSDEEEPASSASVNPEEGCSQDSKYSATPPKQKKPNPAPQDFPECLSEFLSHATLGNKCYTCFLCYTTYEKSMLLYEKLGVEFNALFIGAYNCVDGSGALVFFISGSRHRVSAILNACKKHCTVSFIMVKAVLKNAECYKALQDSKFAVLRESKEGGLHSYDFQEASKKDDCDWNFVADFAADMELTDVLLIMGYYMEFATEPSLCPKCLKSVKAHQHHEKHWANAKLFKTAKNQKGIAQQAADRVLAARRVLMMESTRQDLMVMSFKKQFKVLAEQFGGGVEITQLIGAVAWLDCLLPQFTIKIKEMLSYLVENTPKRRNLLFKGPINSGKTTLAAAILDLLGGVALNVNCSSDKINFELGCAIDKYMVVIEDVKGTPLPNTDLPSGVGMANLDNMRDYLDGCVPVNLERKHINKTSQLFPPCIITCNEYTIPTTVKARVAKGYYFLHKPGLKKSLDANPILMKKRLLQKGCTLLAALIWWEPVSDFVEEIQEEVVNWKQTFEQWVSYGMFQTMKENILSGKDPFEGVLINDPTEENTRETQESTESGIGSMNN